MCWPKPSFEKRALSVLEYVNMESGQWIIGTGMKVSVL